MPETKAIKEIEDFELTDDQSEALENIVEWLESDGELYKTLMGFAGTGKTVLLNEVAKYCKKEGINACFSATTNKAVKVLRSRVNYHDFNTIHSLLSIKPIRKGREEIFVPDKYNKNDISGYDLVVIDECSMISSEDFVDDKGEKRKSLLTIIKDELGLRGIKVLFCGDPAQLQPINEGKTKCFEYKPEMLNKIIRHGDTIANKSKLVRNCDEYVNPDDLIAEPDISRIDIKNIAREFKNFRNNPDRIRMLCWTNDQVKLWNAKLRIADYGRKPDKPFIKGDIVIANEACELNNKIVMNNSEEGIVQDVQERDDYWALEVEKFSGGTVYLNKIKTEYESELKDKLDEWAEEKNWGKFWENKKFYHDIRHCYAMTIHKSQGSTFEKVILDIKDINKNPNLENRNQLMYVGITRASDNVYIY